MENGEDKGGSGAMPVAEPPPHGLVRIGRLLVMPSGGGPVVTLDEANAAVEAVRCRLA
jgi:hypothetical protein